MKILLVVYDNDSYAHSFPLGIAYLVSCLRREGYEPYIYNQDVHHYPEKHLTEYLDKNQFDVIGIGAVGGYYQYRKLLKISKAINAAKGRPPYYILGGHGPSPEPEYFLNKTEADIAVIGEGEETMLGLMHAISNKESLDHVEGIAFRNGSRVVMNPRRPLIADIDKIPWPAYDLFPIEHYRMMRLPHAVNKDFVMPVLTARGCTFKCNFCYRMDEGYRKRNPESIVEEVTYLQTEYQINYIDFADELLMASKSRVVEVCNAILKSKVKFKWYCNGRLNYATRDIVKLMKAAGCVFINYGIEAFDDSVLKNMNKGLTTQQITKGVEATLAEGVSPGFNLIFGNIGEDAETLRKGVEFLLHYSDFAQLRTIRPVTPYPGSPLYYHAIKKKLLEDAADFYENKHLNSDLLTVNFTKMSDAEFYKTLLDANLTLIEAYHQKKLQQMHAITEDLYEHRNCDFRGFRQT